MKRIIVDVLLNLICLALMCLPLYTLGIAPILLIIHNIVFGLKYSHKLFFLRIFSISFVLFIGYKLNIIISEISSINNYNHQLDPMSYWILLIFFVGSLCIAVAAVLIVQCILIIRLMNKRRMNKEII